MAASAALRKWPKVVLFGDSLTQFSFSEVGCFGALLADFLQRKCDIVNRGFSGYNSRWNKLMLPRLVTKEDATDIVAMVLFLGANDSNLPDSTQHVGAEEYKDNLVAMVKYLQSVGVSPDKLILMSPPPCDEDRWRDKMQIDGRPSYQDNQYKQQYAEKCRLAAAETGSIFVDLYHAMMKEQVKEQEPIKAQPVQTGDVVEVKLELGHTAALKKNSAPEDLYTHKWSVFVRGPENTNIQHFIEKVVFHLHHTFPKPKRVVKEPPYQVSEDAYASFHIPIDVYFKNKNEPKKINFVYDMFLRTDEPVNHIRREILTFHNPSEDLKMRLLLAGGVMKSGSADNATTGEEASETQEQSTQPSVPQTTESKANVSDVVKHEETKPKRMKVESPWSKYLCDGLHLSPDGAHFVFSQLRPHIETLTKDLPVIMPDWKELTGENYKDLLG